MKLMLHLNINASAMGLTCLKRTILLIALILQSYFVMGAVVAGTDFEPMVYPGDSIPWDLNSVKQYGMAGNSFSMNPTYSGDGANYRVKEDLDFVYCVTGNPSTLNPDFMEADDYMCVVQYAGAMKEMSSFFNYRISGLRMGTNFTITIDYYVLNTTADVRKYLGVNYDATVDFKVMINPNEWGSNDNYKGVDVATNSFQKKQQVTIKGVVSDPVLELNLLYGYNGKGKGIAIGITEIKVDGTIDPKISSSQGIEACKGEQILLTLDREYNAKTYKWEVKHSGGSWQTLSTQKSTLYEMPSPQNGDVTELFRCTVDGVVSNELEVKGITCCEVNGKPASRKTLLWETFGRFPGKHTYVDKDGNESTTPATWPPYRADLSYTIPQNDFDDGSGHTCVRCGNGNTASGQINDGYYAIVCPMESGAYYQDVAGNSIATWMNGVSTDHTSLITGETNAGALFINVDYYFSGVVFEAEFHNICSGKQVFYETWVANLSNGLSDPIVSIKFFDENGDEIEAINDFVVKANAGWLPLKGSFFIEGSGTHDVKMQLFSSCGSRCEDYSYWDKGNDLIIDDIKFMVCSPPSLEAYSDISTFAKDTTICADQPFTIESPVSTLLVDFFGGNHRFLFQYSGDGGSSWSNISGIESDNQYIINTADYPQDKMQFRVVVATPDVLGTFLADPNLANYDDDCRNYSITKPFTITRAGSLDMGTDFKTSACKGETVNLKGFANPDLSSWKWTDESGTDLIPYSSTKTDMDYSFTLMDETTLYFYGMTADGCVGRRKYTVAVNPTAEISFVLDTVCGKTLLTTTVTPANATIEATLEGAAFTLSSGETEFGATSLLGELEATATATGYCKSLPATTTLIYKQIPEESLAKIDPFCEYINGNMTKSSEATTAPTLPESVNDYQVTWYSDANATILAETDLRKVAGSVSPITYYYTLTLKGCTSKPEPYEFVIKPLATVTVTETNECDLTTLTATTTPSEATVTWNGTETGSVLTLDSPEKAGIYKAVSSASNYCESEEYEVHASYYETPRQLETSSVQYLKLEAKETNGVFNTDKLIAAVKESSKNPSATVMWMGPFAKAVEPSDISSAATSPNAPQADMSVTTDTVVYYYVYQQREFGGLVLDIMTNSVICNSPLSMIEVSILGAPAPTPRDTSICVDDPIDLMDLVVINPAEGKTKDDYELVWEDGSTTAPSVSTSVSGVQTFKVMQREKNTTNISAAVSMNVRVYGVPKPTAEDVIYCLNETPVALKAEHGSTNPTQCLMADGFKWVTIAQSGATSESLNAPVPSTNEARELSYQVISSYDLGLSSGKLCYSEPTDIKVTVCQTNAPAPQTIQYIKADASDGKTFPSIKDARSPWVEETGYEYYYSALLEDASTIPTTGYSTIIPTPVYDVSTLGGGTKELYYYVYRIDKNNPKDCPSDVAKITIRISDALSPQVKDVYVCEGDAVPDLEATVSLLPGSTKTAADYDIWWYGEQDPSVVSASPVNTVSSNTYSTGITSAVVVDHAKTTYKYYVTQKDKSTNAESMPSVVTVYVMPKPVVTPKTIPAQCEGEVLLDTCYVIENLSALSGTINKQYETVDVATESGQYGVTVSYQMEVPAGQVIVASDDVCRSEMKQIAIQIDKIESVAIGDDHAVCPSGTLTLVPHVESSTHSATQMTYNWKDNKNATYTGSSWTITYPENYASENDKLYTYTLTVTAGTCEESSEPFEVKVGDGPVIGTMTAMEEGNGWTPFAFRNDTVREFHSCGETISLSVDYEKTEGDFVWYENGVEYGVGSTITIDATENNSHKTYEVRYINKCDTKASIDIHTNPLIGMVKGPQAICEGMQGKIDASSYAAITYEWKVDDEVVGTTPTLVVKPEKTTTYQIEMTRENCKATDSYELQVTPLPVITSVDSIGIRDREIVMEPGKGTGVFYYWVDVESSKATDNIVYNLTFAKHVVYVRDENGCETSMPFEVIAPPIIIPEFFTPNGDGVNDTWFVETLKEVYPESKVQIYDRYGKLMAEYLGGDSDGWDGLYKGVPMPSTDYWYVIDVEEIDRQFSGHFTLIRQ